MVDQTVGQQAFCQDDSMLSPGCRWFISPVSNAIYGEEYDAYHNVLAAMQSRFKSVILAWQVRPGATPRVEVRSSSVPEYVCIF
jgi:hypothetical protein